LAKESNYLKKLTLIGAAVCSLFTLVYSTQAQGTAFTYQGRLNSGTNVATGSYDVKFTLFAVNAGGSAIVGPVTNAAVDVTNGLFTTIVNLGNLFNGASNWLELAVSTNGANTFFTLAPRQQLTPTPYAIYAETANAAGLSGSVSAGSLPANVAYVNVANNFSQQNIFTSTIKSVGPVSANGYFGILEEDSSDTGDFWILTKWDAALNKRFSIYDGNGVTPIVLQESGGNVGIGTNSPSTALQVAGTVSATAFIGNGNGLTGLNTTNLTGTVADARLSSNVALRAGGNVFTGNQIINSGSVGVGTTTPVTALDVNGTGHFNAGYAQGFYAASFTNQASTGWVALNQGLANAAGYVSWYGSNSYEIAYLGYLNGGATNLGLSLVNGAAFNVNGGNVGIGLGLTTPKSDSLLQVKGMVRMGSETGTSEAPDKSIMVRRIKSTSSAVGQVVAISAGGAMTLERDGTTGGFVIKNTTAGNGVIAATGLDQNGNAVNFYKVLFATGQTTQVFTNTQAMGHFHLSFGEPFIGGDMTEVVLTRFEGGGNDTTIWVGTVTSTVNQ
jgi:hypothetical protein